MNNSNQVNDKANTQKRIIEIAEYNREDILRSLTTNDNKIKLFLGFQSIFAIQAFIFFQETNALEICQSFVFLLWLIFWSITSIILIKNISGTELNVQVKTTDLFEKNYKSYADFLRKYHQALLINIEEARKLLERRVKAFKWSIRFFILSLLPFVIKIIFNCYSIYVP